MTASLQELQDLLDENTLLKQKLAQWESQDLIRRKDAENAVKGIFHLGAYCDSYIREIPRFEIN